MKINKGLISQKNDGKVTIFDGEKSELITFNETATFIFERIKRGIDEEKIVEMMSKKFDVDMSTLKKDVKEFIQELKKQKIISIK